MMGLVRIVISDRDPYRLEDIRRIQKDMVRTRSVEDVIAEALVGSDAVGARLKPGFRWSMRPALGRRRCCRME
jgi:hypothetical protein